MSQKKSSICSCRSWIGKRHILHGSAHFEKFGETPSRPFCVCEKNRFPAYSFPSLAVIQVDSATKKRHCRLTASKYEAARGRGSGWKKEFRRAISKETMAEYFLRFVLYCNTCCSMKPQAAVFENSKWILKMEISFFTPRWAYIDSYYVVPSCRHA